MAKRFIKKTALWALVILVAACCVFFACACEDKTVTLDLSASGEVIGGAELSLIASFKGKEDAVAAYKEEAVLYELVSGEDVVTLIGDTITVADDARAGDEFSIRVTAGGLSVLKTFTVTAPKPIESVTLFCPETATAGEVIALTSKVKPNITDTLVVYSVVSGEATVQGNTLTVSSTADGGEVIVSATAGGKSDQKTIRIVTRQTQEVYLSLSGSYALPGGSIPFVATKVPANSSYPITYRVEGDGLATVDDVHSLICIKEDAPMNSTFTVVAVSGSKEARVTVTVDYPPAEEISARGGLVIPGTERELEFTLYPESANRRAVEVSVLEGASLIEWQQGATSFRVLDNAAANSEITFMLKVSDDVLTAVTYRVGVKELTSLTISASGTEGYLASGDSVTFACVTDPVDVDQAIRYRATQGADLVTINNNVLTVKDGADIGVVTVVAESDDGTCSNEIQLNVKGRYSRRVYSSWENVSFSNGGGENSAVWMVLPAGFDVGGLTVLVPYEVVDLVIEGRYDGTEQTAYRDLYFYFRNTAQRTVTLMNFATVATKGLGGTIFDLGSSGETEVVLKGQNLIRADSPYYIDNTGEDINGAWNVGYSDGSNQQAARRAGKPGYRGTAGGTAISGYSLTFRGDGALTAVAGSGVNGTPGGKGADAIYDGGLNYISGAGGNGGNGGDSGAAIHAYKAAFVSGMVTAVPGDAGKGGAGGAAGSVAYLAGYDVTKAQGVTGVKGEDGTPYGAVNAKIISGAAYTSSVGEVKNSTAVFTGSLLDLTSRLSSFYDINVHYGTDLYNPYKKKPKSSRYTMVEQTDAATLMLQANFLMYTLSVMPKNCWQEVKTRCKRVSVYLCKSITSGSGSVILGLTSDDNNVWFATFNTSLRGVLYSGYFNIMVHEFIHVFHYQFSKAARSTFEAGLKSYNYGLSYNVSYGSTERVYGFGTASNPYDETNSCFFTAYSRKSVMEDASETVSMACTFGAAIGPMAKGTNLYNKFIYLAESFGRDYETLSPFVTGKVLFGDRRLVA